MASRNVLRMFLLLSSLLSADALFWTATERFILYTSVETVTYTYLTGTDRYFYYTSPSLTATVSPGVTPTTTPVSSTTYYDTYRNIELVSLYYRTGAVADSDLVPTTTTETDTTSTYTLYSMSITYTPPPSCSATWKYTTRTTVNIPSEVVDQLTPVTVITSTPYVISYSTGFYTGSPYVTWWLSDGAAPLTTTGPYADYYYTKDVYYCRKPGSSSSYDDDDDEYGDLKVCTLYSGCTSLKTWIIIVATVLATLFVLGWIESYFWFRRLMTGRSALRFGTVCWILISLWVLCFTRRQKPRPVQDQIYLKQQWNQIPFGRRIKLWFKWGFRHAYPAALLGEYVPPAGTVIYRSGQPIRDRNGQLVGGNTDGGYGPPPGMPPPAYVSEAGRNIEAIQPMPPPAPYVPGSDEEKGVAKSVTKEGYVQGGSSADASVAPAGPSAPPSVPPQSKEQ